MKKIPYTNIFTRALDEDWTRHSQLAYSGYPQWNFKQGKSTGYNQKNSIGSVMNHKFCYKCTGLDLNYSLERVLKFKKDIIKTK